eukprot:PhM_4_TR4507/c0_g1_i1/m.7732
MTTTQYHLLYSFPKLLSGDFEEVSTRHTHVPTRTLCVPQFSEDLQVPGHAFPSPLIPRDMIATALHRVFPVDSDRQLRHRVELLGFCDEGDALLHDMCWYAFLTLYGRHYAQAPASREEVFAERSRRLLSVMDDDDVMQTLSFFSNEFVADASDTTIGLTSISATTSSRQQVRRMRPTEFVHLMHEAFEIDVPLPAAECVLNALKERHVEVGRKELGSYIRVSPITMLSFDELEEERRKLRSRIALRYFKRIRVFTLNPTLTRRRDILAPKLLEVLCTAAMNSIWETFANLPDKSELEEEVKSCLYFMCAGVPPPSTSVEAMHMSPESSSGGAKTHRGPPHQHHRQQQQQHRHSGDGVESTSLASSVSSRSPSITEASGGLSPSTLVGASAVDKSGLTSAFQRLQRDSEKRYTEYVRVLTEEHESRHVDRSAAHYKEHVPASARSTLTMPKNPRMVGWYERGREKHIPYYSWKLSLPQQPFEFLACSPIMQHSLKSVTPATIPHVNISIAAEPPVVPRPPALSARTPTAPKQHQHRHNRHPQRTAHRGGVTTPTRASRAVVGGSPEEVQSPMSPRSDSVRSPTRDRRRSSAKPLKQKSACPGAAAAVRAVTQEHNVAVASVTAMYDEAVAEVEEMKHISVTERDHPVRLMQRYQRLNQYIDKLFAHPVHARYLTKTQRLGLVGMSTEIVKEISRLRRQHQANMTNRQAVPH